MGKKSNSLKRRPVLLFFIFYGILLFSFTFIYDFYKFYTVEGNPYPQENTVVDGNDNFSSACLIQPGYIWGTLDSSDVADYYLIPLDNGTQLVVNFTYSGFLGYSPTLKLYDQEQRFVTSRTNNNTNDLRLVLIFNSTSWAYYYIVLQMPNMTSTAGSYSGNIFINAFEDNNNNFTTAQHFEDGPIFGLFGGNDSIDVYSLNLDAGTTITVQLLSAGFYTYYVDAYLYDSNQSTLAYDNIGINVNITYTVSENITCYIVIKTLELNTNGSYFGKVSLYP
ncbi:MAG: hypothetical protein ACTSWN_06400 [Promethearchaeota archaeon]